MKIDKYFSAGALLALSLLATMALTLGAGVKWDWY